MQESPRAIRMYGELIDQGAITQSLVDEIHSLEDCHHFCLETAIFYDAGWNVAEWLRSFPSDMRRNPE